ncbi:hypothetical protein GQ44DRAFT_816019 [Phaeosphaeriaceae sp. PMI808]|nr:hypothetical protein GQ44DRAFT_816017 [Phaeosphaeriaceae sp. PMI808]KAH8708425.1 hypothetical protein GQ44DRAFT_816019 [Phaeosphaeriaceae sp. PMI808]
MLTKASFISTTINNSLVVRSTKVDSTLKAIINNYRKFKDINSTYIVDYLNTIRIVYYLSRLSYYNKDRYRVTLNLLRKANIDLEYLFLLDNNRIDSTLATILESINKYLIRTSILFRDYNLIKSFIKELKDIRNYSNLYEDFIASNLEGLEFLDSIIVDKS